jgi:hypothetical protein
VIGFDNDVFFEILEELTERLTFFGLDLASAVMDSIL